MSAILQVFDGLDRCAPGDVAGVTMATAGLARDGVVLDAGCGRGADLAMLRAAVPEGRVVAVDLTPPFIDHVRAMFPDVRAEVADMLDPSGGPFDLIWSGGAVYGPGVAACLGAWGRHLRPGGRIAFTELCWRSANPAPAARAFWGMEYPAMGDAAALDACIVGAGYRLIAADWLSPSAWAAYYDPLARRLAACAGDPDPEMQQVLAAFGAEIAVWRAHGDDFGYRLCVVERA